jgi:2-aminoadipate transaminase
MKSSAMRDLMAITERPEVISLAGGLPDTSTFPPDSYAALMAQVASESCARALQYGPTEGLAAVKRSVVQVMTEEGTPVDPDDVLMTTGGQQVIDLVCKALIDPGDVIVAEAPTYPGAIPAFLAYEADVVQIAMDGDGMRIDELEQTLDRLEEQRRRPKFIYTIPNFQNPGGVTMSLPRRRRLVALAQERELLVLEDNPYGLLRYEGEALPTLRALEQATIAREEASFVIYLGTFSKILSPGARLGWAVAPRPVLEKLNVGKASTDLCSSPMTQYFVAAYFESGQWAPYLRSLRSIYRSRRDAMLDALAENLGTDPPPELDWTRPQGGLFLWVNLPGYIDTTDLLARALGENVAFVPGASAYAARRPPGPEPAAARASPAPARAPASRPVPAWPTCSTSRADPRPTSGRARARTGEPRRGAQGRPLAGAAGLAEVRSAGRGRARPPGARADPDRRGRRPRRPAARRAGGGRLRGHARSRRRGRHGAGAARACGHPLHRLGRVGLRAQRGQGPGQAHDARRRDPDARVLLVHRDRLLRAGRGRRAAGDRGAPGLPDRGQARRPGVGAGDQVRASRRRRPGRPCGGLFL